MKPNGQRVREEARAMTRHDAFASAIWSKYAPVRRTDAPAAPFVYRKGERSSRPKTAGKIIVRVQAPAVPPAVPGERVRERERIVEKLRIVEKERVVEKERLVIRNVFVMREADRIVREQRLLRERALAPQSSQEEVSGEERPAEAATIHPRRKAKGKGGSAEEGTQASGETFSPGSAQPRNRGAGSRSEAAKPPFGPFEEDAPAESERAAPSPRPTRSGRKKHVDIPDPGSDAFADDRAADTGDSGSDAGAEGGSAVRGSGVSARVSSASRNGKQPTGISTSSASRNGKQPTGTSASSASRNGKRPTGTGVSPGSRPEPKPLWPTRDAFKGAADREVAWFAASRDFVDTGEAFGPVKGIWIRAGSPIPVGNPFFLNGLLSATTPSFAGSARELLVLEPLRLVGRVLRRWDGYGISASRPEQWLKTRLASAPMQRQDPAESTERASRDGRRQSNDEAAPTPRKPRSLGTVPVALERPDPGGGAIRRGAPLGGTERIPGPGKKRRGREASPKLQAQPLSAPLREPETRLTFAGWLAGRNRRLGAPRSLPFASASGVRPMGRPRPRPMSKTAEAFDAQHASEQATVARTTYTQAKEPALARRIPGTAPAAESPNGLAGKSRAGDRAPVPLPDVRSEESVRTETSAEPLRSESTIAPPTGGTPRQDAQTSVPAIGQASAGSPENASRGTGNETNESDNANGAASGAYTHRQSPEEKRDPDPDPKPPSPDPGAGFASMAHPTVQRTGRRPANAFARIDASAAQSAIADRPRTTAAFQDAIRPAAIRRPIRSEETYPLPIVPVYRRGTVRGRFAESPMRPRKPDSPRQSPLAEAAQRNAASQPRRSAIEGVWNTTGGPLSGPGGPILERLDRNYRRASALSRQTDFAARQANREVLSQQSGNPARELASLRSIVTRESRREDLTLLSAIASRELSREGLSPPSAIAFREPNREGWTPASATAFREPNRIGLSPASAIAFREPNREGWTPASAIAFREPNREGVTPQAGAAVFREPDRDGHSPLEAYAASAPALVRHSRSYPAAPSGGASASGAGAPAPIVATLEMRRPERPAPAAAQPQEIVVESPRAIDEEQLKAALGKMPELRPEKLADEVYKALMKRIKFEQRTRGY
ncbi:hypothetical protein ACF3MZ_16920 [Paenibacillaceae bacterium WGS1546]|uniref:hypothetical protein n=1 Tax=Cohnella sp. WGS1546 TaxID=3366810 RepID=UPI00372D7AF9